MFRETGANPLRMLQKFVCAILYACFFFGAEGLASEVITAGVKTSLDEAGIEFHEILHLLLLDDLCHMRLLGSVELGEVHGEVCIRF